jgi:phage major head subunit gpT-like protein
MAQWTVAHVLTTEDRLTKIQNNAYALALENAWWDRIMVEKPSTGQDENYEWLLTTAGIERLNKGQMVYEDIATASWAIENTDWGKGLKIPRNKFMDDRFQFASDWMADIGGAMALNPQYIAVDLINNGETGLCWTGKAFFAADHPVNKYDTSKGTYRNLVTQVGQIISGGGTGAPSLTVANFAAGVAHMQGYVMENGRNRNLQPKLLVTGPKLRKEAVEITGARFISSTENVIASSYNVEPMVINEITGLDWYLVAGNVGSNLGGPLIYQVREQFWMTSYEGTTQAQLNQSNELEWQVRGRGEGSYGHPFHMIKFKVT